MSAKVTTRHHQAVAAALAEFKADWNLLDTFGQAAVLEQIIAQARVLEGLAEHTLAATVRSRGQS